MYVYVYIYICMYIYIYIYIHIYICICICVLKNIIECAFSGDTIKNTLISLEMELFGVINLNTYISSQGTLHKGRCNTLLSVVISKW